MIEQHEFNVAGSTAYIPADRYYDGQTHFWALVEPATGLVRVGMDALGLAALGDLAYVTLPSVGALVQRGKSMGTLEAAKMTGGMIAPLSGAVVARNESVERNPSLINLDPYDNGWLVLIKPEDWPAESRLLVADDGLPGWVESELQRYRLQGWID